MTREEAIKSLVEDGINLGAGDFVEVEALKIAVADMLSMERLEQTRALVVRECSEDELQKLCVALEHAACGIVKLEPGEDIWALTTCKGVEIDQVKNDPLTPDDLRQMGGEPVYVVPADPMHKSLGGWCVMCEETTHAEVPGVEYWDWNVERYGETWTAYRRRPDEHAAPQKNDPLTIEEMQQALDADNGGLHIWLKDFDCPSFPWAAIIDREGGKIVAMMGADREHCFFHEVDYGKTWLAYRQKPTEAP